MSPKLAAVRVRERSFPRVSGDEPAVAGGNADTFKFSPRERG